MSVDRWACAVDDAGAVWLSPPTLLDLRRLARVEYRVDVVNEHGVELAAGFVLRSGEFVAVDAACESWPIATGSVVEAVVTTYGP